MANVTRPNKLKPSKLQIGELQARKLNIILDFAGYQLRQLGLRGQLGLLLLLGSLAYLFLIATPQASQLQQLQLDAASFNKNSKRYAQDHHIMQFDVVKDFYRILPAQNQVNNKISVILNAAKNAGLSLEKVEYEQPLAHFPVAQYQIKLPIKGSYIQIRQFINEVLNEIPSIALIDLSMRRDDIATDVLDTNIQFTLYLKSAS